MHSSIYNHIFIKFLFKNAINGSDNNVFLRKKGNINTYIGELDVSSPTPRLSSLRILLTLAIKFDLAVHIADIDTAFTYA